MLLFRQPCVQFGLQATRPLKDYTRNRDPEEVSLSLNSGVPSIEVTNVKIMCTEHFSGTKFCVSLIEASERGGPNVKALESAEVHSTRKRNRLVPSFRISNVEMLEPALQKGNKTECKAGNTVRG